MSWSVAEGKLPIRSSQHLVRHFLGNYFDLVQQLPPKMIYDAPLIIHLESSGLASTPLPACT
ncbi:MAG: hypothetical protein OQK04_10500 [Kangiellaceae bacterium]|nr:hypothetical protein [Kangiellaceae bacterium]MCW8999135.1 hypothetical protein [Kangiellaceae bacterium]